MTSVSAAPIPVSRRVEAWRFTAQDQAERSELIADEVPVALVYNGQTFVVMLATPADLEDFAVGFSLTEGIVSNASGLTDLAVEEVADGLKVHASLTAGRFDLLRHRHRNLMGGSSCGLCGSDSFAEALRPVTRVGGSAAFHPEAVRRAMAALPSLQVLNHDLGAIHAAGFADATGDLLAVREDVGRHNALDKLIGHLARAGIDAGSGFVVVSSRCSFEMIHKTAAAGIPLIAAVSAPTAMAIRVADDAHVGLLAFAREGRFTLYAGRDRVIEDRPRLVG